jgi:hypothetical protein
VKLQGACEAHVLRLVVPLALEHGIDCSAQARTANGFKNRIRLELL